MRLLVVFVVLTIGAPARAQVAIFEPGYLLQEGTRTTGWIGLRTEAENAVRVRFRSTLQGAVTEFGPSEIDGYGTDAGLAYRSGPYRVQPPGYEDSTVPTARLGFARVVRDGAWDLLAFEVRDRAPVFFVTDGDGEPIGLYNVTLGGGPARVETVRPLYRQALLVALGGCAGPLAAFENLPYTEAALAARIEAANVCADPSYVRIETVQAVRRPVVDRVEVGAGVTAGRIDRLQARPDASYPGVVAPYAEVAVVLNTPSARWLRFVGGAAYSAGTVDLLVFMGRGFGVRRVSTAHLVLGARGVAELGGVGVEASAGLLIGTTVQRVIAEQVTVADYRRSAIFGVRREDFTSSGGQYAEVGLRLPHYPVSLVTRVQRTLYSNGRVYLPGSQGYLHRHDTISVGARVSF